MLRFLTDELQDAEDAGDRGMHVLYSNASVSDTSQMLTVWIVGHVLSGWSAFHH
jgi:hypothetical protein